MTRTIILFLTIFQWSLPAFCRNAADSSFALVFISTEVKYDPLKLSDEISQQKTLDDVKKLVRKKITEAKCTVIVSFTRNGLFYRWERRTGEISQDKVEEWIVLGKRGTSGITITRPEEFQKILRDTIVVLDTLSISVRFNTEAMDPDSYQLRLHCGKTEIVRPVTHKPIRELVFTDSLLRNCASLAATHVRLFNEGSPAFTLADFYLLSPGVKLRKEWRGVADGLRRNDPSLSMEEVAGYLQSYIKSRHLDCSREELTHWLAKQP